jgi:transcriptional regulator with XRE-family HTH domain
MTATAFARAVAQAERRALASFGEEVRRLREDAGLIRAALARAAGIDASYLADIENGAARPSIETCLRLTMALGADLPLRLYPTTGPSVRDRHQSPIAEALLAALHPRWKAFTELATRRPSRGWVDMGLHDARASVFVATEIQSELRRIEQLIRWSDAKADSLPSWDGWRLLGEPPVISRLLIVRETRSNRELAAEFRRLLRTAYPADATDALAALSGPDNWPGPALLWAARDRAGGYRLVVRS